MVVGGVTLWALKLKGWGKGERKVVGGKHEW